MLRIFPVFLVILGLLLPEAGAQTTTKSRTAKASAVAAEPTPAPRKLSFFERLFGRRRKPAPAPATPTPAPKVTSKSRKPRTSATKPTTARSTSARPKAATTAATEPPAEAPEKPAPAPSTEPEPEKPAPKPAATKPTTKKSSGKPATTAKTVPMEPGGVDQDELDRQKYDAAKAKAMEDPEVAALKKKADEAISDDDANKAQRAYNKALFAKMRKIEPAIRERIDRMEAAMMKRLNDQPGAR